MVKNQLRILVPEMDFLEIIAAGDLTVTHAVVDSINREDLISNEIEISTDNITNDIFIHN